MKELIGTVIVGVLTIPLTIIVLKLIAKREDKKSYDIWICDCRYCFGRITRIYSGECQRLLEKALEQYTYILLTKSYRSLLGISFITNYQKSIENLKEEYIKNMYAKLSEMMYKKITTIPDFLVKEYEDNIKEYYYIFSKFGNQMWYQLREAEQQYRI